VRRLLLLLALACSAALAQPLALPPPPRAGLQQHIGGQVPLDTVVTDEAGRSQRLGAIVDGTRPVLLVPGYYRCAQLCGLVMRGLLEALHASGAGRAQWRIVGIGIDPTETPADARARHAQDLAYADSLAEASTATPLDLHLLTLQAADLQRVAAAIGIRFERVPPAGADPATIAHPATVVLLTPQGRVARYFNGLGIAPGELRVALADAAGDRLGAATSRLALLCAHFDPHVGRLDIPVMNGVRAGSLLVLAGLAGWCWRRRGTGGRSGR
jgi:protein SCO1